MRYIDTCDIVIIGGGVIGTAILYSLTGQYSKFKIYLLEKEEQLSLHQSGRNSGVIHQGYNQTPGSLKAKFVVEGSRRLKEFCRLHSVPIREKGIVVIAKEEREVDNLLKLYKNAKANGAKVEIIDKEKLKRIEPYVAGICALFAPEGASFDSRKYVLALADESKARGGKIFVSERVDKIIEENSYINIITNKRILQGKIVINCAGLHADRFAKMLGLSKNYQIIPFKGEYYELIPEKRYLVNSHIYPVPNPQFPFLGIHLSKTVDERVIIGPSALLCGGRESYQKFGCNPGDTISMLTWQGFWNMLISKKFIALMKKEWKKSLLKSEVVKEIKELLPVINSSSLVPFQCGIRAQLVDKRGSLVNDFIIEETRRSIHILNAVSPGLTCALPFADYISNLVAKKL
ncbi:MAG: L-2-hydroxyglutarate oxidase [Planctomycetota bacterium]